jgi:dTDP-4-dehydrorhamnose 3,5-epimerase
MSTAHEGPLFTANPSPIAGLMVVQRRRMGDSRGALSRIFCAEAFREFGWGATVAQINHSYTGRAGTVRGLHYQRPPLAEAKFVTCLQGRIWDIVVDLRAGSPTFLQWYAHELSAQGLESLLIPPGCAHGFQALVDDSELVYLHSKKYSSKLEGGFRPMDPLLSIKWPLPITEVSERDRAHPLLDATFLGLKVR